VVPNNGQEEIRGGGDRMDLGTENNGKNYAEKGSVATIFTEVEYLSTIIIQVLTLIPIT